MEMPDLICTETLAMAVTPQTPGSPAAEAEGNTSPRKPPEVQRARLVRKLAKRCLMTAFGERAFMREDSPDADPPVLALTPRRVLPGEEAEDKGKGPADAPSRPRKKSCMDGGSSAHNSQAKTLQRSVSTALEVSVTRCIGSHEEIETLFSQGGSGLHTPPRSVVKLQMDLDLSPLQGLKLFDRFELFGDSDEELAV